MARTVPGERAPRGRSDELVTTAAAVLLGNAKLACESLVLPVTAMRTEPPERGVEVVNGADRLPALGAAMLLELNAGTDPLARREA